VSRRVEVLLVSAASARRQRGVGEASAWRQLGRGIGVASVGVGIALIIARR
jgi:hypothetical protein